MAAKIVILSALVAIAHAGVVAGPYGGHSTSSRKQDDFGNYNFNYQVTDGLGASNGRWEAGNAWGGVVGSYNLADIDGRSRRVDYVADGAGFRAKVKTNEPGTAASLPAAAVIASPYPGHVSHGPVAGPVVAKAVFAAPAIAAPVYAAPVVAKAVVGPAFGAGYGGAGFAGLGHGRGLGYGHGAGFGGFGHGVAAYGAGAGFGHGAYGAGAYGAGAYGAGAYGHGGFGGHGAYGHGGYGHGGYGGYGHHG